MRKSTAKIKEIGKNGIEAYLREQVRLRGGECIKQNPNWFTGVYDRLVALPGGKLCFVETKRPVGGKLRGSQIGFKKRLQKLQIEHYELYTHEQIDEFLKPYPRKRGNV